MTRSSLLVFWFSYVLVGTNTFHLSLGHFSCSGFAFVSFFSQLQDVRHILDIIHVLNQKRKNIFLSIYFIARRKGKPMTNFSSPELLHILNPNLIASKENGSWCSFGAVHHHGRHHQDRCQLSTLNFNFSVKFRINQ